MFVRLQVCVIDAADEEDVGVDNEVP